MAILYGIFLIFILPNFTAFGIPEDWLASLGYEDFDGTYVHHCHGVFTNLGERYKGRIILTTYDCISELQVKLKPQAKFYGLDAALDVIDFHMVETEWTNYLALVLLRDPLHSVPIKIPKEEIKENCLSIIKWQDLKGGQDTVPTRVPLADITGLSREDKKYYVSIYTGNSSMEDYSLKGSPIYKKSPEGLVGLHSYRTDRGDGTSLRTYIVIYWQRKPIREAVKTFEQKRNVGAMRT